MTYNEYRKLVQEYRDTDSIKRGNEIKSLVYKTAKALLRTLQMTYLGYGKRFVEDSDYREDRGCLELDEFGEINVYFLYSDHWQYGGECNFGIKVPMKYLDASELRKLESELKSERIPQLKQLMATYSKQIGNLQEQLAKCERELKILEGGAGEECPANCINREEQEK